LLFLLIVTIGGGNCGDGGGCGEGGVGGDCSSCSEVGDDGDGSGCGEGGVGGGGGGGFV
jgi:hypothetical protein